jgi:hypothetical protein
MRTEANATNRAKGFFDRWQPLDSGKRGDCLSNDLLASLAADTAQRNEHLENCMQCKEIVELLRQPSDIRSRDFQRFLTDLRADAQKAVARESGSIPRYLWSFFAVGGPRQIAAYATGIGLLIVAATLPTYLEYYSSPPQSIAVSFPEDPVGSVVEQLRTSTEELSRGTVQPEQIPAQVTQLNARLRRINLSLPTVIE